LPGTVASAAGGSGLRAANIENIIVNYMVSV